ncbi:hypothetical protein NLG97_g10010 [Lecanicillium saksenae]|uniref:Uncharacterized protein n=1 Tax=Lecanicillium saksenae TaxID=468837 RepID=A0ACC1QG84_9HYPO|nr:hypothetical protein NLG97_g10010 [Lecanicillium saksenae]
MVGFVGDAGAGKSSVINSLLDFAGLVKSAGDGGACTAVATEFHYHDSDTFSIEVELFSESELLESLMLLLSFYCSWHNEEDEARGGGDKERAKLATDTFGSMFQGQLSADTLQKTTENGMRLLFARLIAEFRPSNENLVQIGLTQERCKDELQRFSESKSSTWPFIRKIKLFSNAHILSRGLILVDLPGLRDSNSARRNITEKCARQCDEIFAVCDISRAVDDSTVQYIFDMAKHLHNVSIICTHSEAIQAEEAMRDWKGQELRDLRALHDIIGAESRDSLQLRKMISDISDQDDPTPDLMARSWKLQRRRATVEKSLEDNEYKEKKLLMEARNHNITQRLRSKYSELTVHDRLEVFCVSNMEYQGKRNLPQNESLRYLNLSGIFALRRYCVSLVSESQHRAAKEFIMGQVPELLEKVAIWIQSGADTLNAERRLAVMRAVDALESQLTSALDDPTGPLNNIPEFLSEQYRRRISGPSYNAFCRKYGEHAPKNERHRNWNAEASEQMVCDLQGPWDELEKSVGGNRDAVVGSLKRAYALVVANAGSELRNGLISHVHRALNAKQRAFLYEIDAILYQTEMNIRELRIDGLSAIYTSFLVGLMKATYEECGMDSGSGLTQRNQHRITRDFSDERLFLRLMAKIDSGFRELTSKTEEAVLKAKESYLEQVGATLDLARDENTARESRRDLAFHGRVRQAMEVAKQRIQAVCDGIDA